MPSVLSKSLGKELSRQGRVIVPVIGTNRPEQKDLQKGKYVVLKCRVNPANNSSLTFNLPVPIFQNSSPEE